ncbi:MAG: tail fiber domain-containing protein, partial [Acidobacteria bacterium]|nr:tail fiber domain-containing protein [Acidobacteriota bacterium]
EKTLCLGASVVNVFVPAGLTLISIHRSAPGNAAAPKSSGTVNAVTQFNLGGLRILSSGGTRNLFAGIGAGSANTGSDNAFFGHSSGQANTTGFNNSFFGSGAGAANVGGRNNLFFGNNAGRLNITNNNNIFIGNNAGGLEESKQPDSSIIIGNNSTIVGNNSIVIGNDVALGSPNAPNDNTIVIGKPNQSTYVNGHFFSYFNGQKHVVQTVPRSSLSPGGLFVTQLYLDTPPQGPGTQRLCIAGTTENLYSVLAFCATRRDSAQYKAAIEPFSHGLDVIKRINPVSFKWKDSGKTDIGLNAEDVAAVAPSLVSRDKSGQLDEVNENAVDLLLINAVKEQQKQIESQRQLIDRQQQQIDDLKKTVCAQNPAAGMCKEQGVVKNVVGN